MASFKLHGKAIDSVQLTLGGGFPFSWDLYDYAPAGNGWSRNYLGKGDGTGWFKLPEGDYDQHMLTWSVAVIDHDAQSMQVEVVASARDAHGKPLASAASDWTVSAEVAQIFVTVGIEK